MNRNYFLLICCLFVSSFGFSSEKTSTEVAQKSSLGKVAPATQLPENSSLLSDGESFQKNTHRVYCGVYSDANVNGYSLFRVIDNEDIGNAIWTSPAECEEAAYQVNYLQSPIACAKYVTDKLNGYSLYRVDTNKDLGNSIINDFSQCQRFLEDAARSGFDVFCSKYVKDELRGFSLYRFSDGVDLGNAIFSSAEECSRASANLYRGHFCAKYVQENVSGYSIYDLYSGDDIGTAVYSSLDGCFDQLYDPYRP